MSEQGAPVEGFGDFYPEAAGHEPYNEAMAAWRNQVKAMQAEGTLPRTQEPAESLSEPPVDSETPEAPSGSEEEQEPIQRTMEEALDLNPDGTAAEGEPDASDEPREVYDPAEHNAPEVLGYLKGVGYDEAERVLESERAGRARKGILNLTDDVLAKARENDETGSGSTS